MIPIDWNLPGILTDKLEFFLELLPLAVRCDADSKIPERFQKTGTRLEFWNVSSLFQDSRAIPANWNWVGILESSLGWMFI